MNVKNLGATFLILFSLCNTSIAFWLYIVGINQWNEYENMHIGGKELVKGNTND